MGDEGQAGSIRGEPQAVHCPEGDQPAGLPGHGNERLHDGRQQALEGQATFATAHAADGDRQGSTPAQLLVLHSIQILSSS